MVLLSSSWQSHCERLRGSFDEYKLSARCSRQPSDTQANLLSPSYLAASPHVGWCHPHHHRYYYWTRKLIIISFYRPNGGARYTIGKIIDFRPISRYIPETVGLQDRYIDAACAAVLTKENLRWWRRKLLTSLAAMLLLTHRFPIFSASCFLSIIIYVRKSFLFPRLSNLKMHCK